MTVSHLTRTRDQLWSDLLVALGGSEAFLTRSLSERKILLEILDTYGSSVSLLTVDDVDALLSAVVNAAGGTASHLRQSKHEMLAALVSALGGAAPSASSCSIGELLAACVNAADTGGGGGAPEWVPEDAKIYVDFINDRAWTEADGEVEIDTLLGTDANTSNGWNDSTYDAGNLTVDGYVVEGGTPPALIGAALSAVLSGATVVIRSRNNGGLGRNTNFVLLAADGNDGIEATLIEGGSNNILIASYSGPLSINDGPSCANYLATNDAINVIAITITNTRIEVAANGADLREGNIGPTDRPAGNPFVAALVDSPSNALQSITIYDALPSTAGLSALSVA